MAVQQLSSFSCENLDIIILSAQSTASEAPTVTIPAPQNYRAIGGGARVDWTGAVSGGNTGGAQSGNGALLTAMYPDIPRKSEDSQTGSTDGMAWTVSSKDQIYKFTHTVTAFGIFAAWNGGQQIPSQYYMSYAEDTLTAPAVAHPIHTTPLPANFTLVGGGAQAFFSPKGGQLLTDCRPDFTNSSWIGASKDQAISDPSFIKVWAVGLDSTFLTDQCHVEVHAKGPVSSQLQAPYPTSLITTDFFLIGGGGVDNYGKGQGNMLWASFPDDVMGGAAVAPFQMWRVAGKDDHYKDPASVDAYCIWIGSNRSSCPLTDELIQSIRNSKNKAK